MAAPDAHPAVNAAPETELNGSEKRPIQLGRKSAVQTMYERLAADLTKRVDAAMQDLRANPTVKGTMKSTTDKLKAVVTDLEDVMATMI